MKMLKPHVADEVVRDGDATSVNVAREARDDHDAGTPASASAGATPMLMLQLLLDGRRGVNHERIENALALERAHRRELLRSLVSSWVAPGRRRTS